MQDRILEHHQKVIPRVGGGGALRPPCHLSALENIFHFQNRGQLLHKTVRINNGDDDGGSERREENDSSPKVLQQQHFRNDGSEFCETGRDDVDDENDSSSRITASTSCKASTITPAISTFARHDRRKSSSCRRRRHVKGVNSNLIQGQRLLLSENGTIS